MNKIPGVPYGMSKTAFGLWWGARGTKVVGKERILKQDPTTWKAPGLTADHVSWESLVIGGRAHEVYELYQQLVGMS